MNDTVSEDRLREIISSKETQVEHRGFPTKVEQEVLSALRELLEVRAYLAATKPPLADVTAETFDALETLGKQHPHIRGYFARATDGADLQLVVQYLASATDGALAALKPFADAAEDIDDSEPDNREMWEHPASMAVTVADFRRARTALNPKERLDALLERARSNNPSRKETI